MDPDILDTTMKDEEEIEIWKSESENPGQSDGKDIQGLELDYGIIFSLFFCQLS